MTPKKTSRIADDRYIHEIRMHRDLRHSRTQTEMGFLYGELELLASILPVGFSFIVLLRCEPSFLSPRSLIQSHVWIAGLINLIGTKSNTEHTPV